MNEFNKITSLMGLLDPKRSGTDLRRMVRALRTSLLNVRPDSSERGTTILELMVVLGLMTILLGTAVSNLKIANRPLENATAEVQSFFKQARAKAIGTTSAYTVSAVSPTHLVTSVAPTCASTNPPVDGTLALTLPRGTRIADTTWSICFSARGFASDDLNLTVSDDSANFRTIQVFLGGGVRSQ